MEDSSATRAPAPPLPISAKQLRSSRICMHYKKKVVADMIRARVKGSSSREQHARHLLQTALQQPAPPGDHNVLWYLGMHLASTW